MTKVLELFGKPTSRTNADWTSLVKDQPCPFLERTCIKGRKSKPEIAIGTCTVAYGPSKTPTLICPIRLLERGQIFTDCISLLTTHEVGNELHVVPEISLPGGNVDYFLASVRNKSVRDFVGVELQTMDTTGTVWPERQKFLRSLGIKVRLPAAEADKGFGMNWKMTAKTTLVQLHHKIKTFEHISKHLVLVLQDSLLNYMRKEFKFGHLQQPLLGNPMHIHAYRVTTQQNGSLRLELDSRLSTDSSGIARCLGLKAKPKVDLQEIIKLIEAKISDDTLFTLR